MHASMKCIHKHIHIHVHTCIHTYTHKNSCIHAYIHACMHIQPDTHNKRFLECGRVLSKFDQSQIYIGIHLFDPQKQLPDAPANSQLAALVLHFDHGRVRHTVVNDATPQVKQSLGSCRTVAALQRCQIYVVQLQQRQCWGRRRRTSCSKSSHPCDRLLVLWT